MRGHFNENPPDLTIRGILGTIRLLAEVAVQQASESLAVTGLVASHLVSHFAPLVTSIPAIPMD